MDKPTLLYASPLPPQQSGIAVYSRWMIQALAEYFDITLYLDRDDAQETEESSFPVLRRCRDHIDFASFDHRLYHIGNHPKYHAHIYKTCLQNPGWVVLHEFALYYLVVGVYRNERDFYQKIFRIGGARAISALKNTAREGIDPLQFRSAERVPLNQELLRSGNRLLVHSDYTYRLVQECAPEAKVYRTEHLQGRTAATNTSRADWLARWGLPADAVVVASFGFVAPTKLNHVVCNAVERLVKQQGAPLYYLMVGEGDYIVSRIGGRIRLTGYASETEFDECIAHADLIVNLRYPTVGETSGALLRGLWTGKPCIVTDVGWFSELPDSVVLKLDASDPALIEEHLVEALEIFLGCPLPFQKMAQEAASYVRERHSTAAVARQYFELLTQS
jgi:glycosyltransferase involved in cell wall biosynthesis